MINQCQFMINQDYSFHALKYWKETKRQTKAKKLLNILFIASRTNCKLFIGRLFNLDLIENSVALKRFSVITPVWPSHLQLYSTVYSFVFPLFLSYYSWHHILITIYISTCLLLKGLGWGEWVWGGGGSLTRQFHWIY